MEPLKKHQDPIFLAYKNKSIDFMKAYQEQDVNKMLSFCSPDCQVQFLPLGEEGSGNVHIVGKAIWSSLIDCFPTIDNTVHNATNERGEVRCEVTIWGQQVKDFAGLTSKGNEFEEDHIFIFRVGETGMIENICIDWNHENFVRQLQA